MFVCSLREFPENCVYKQAELNCWIFAQKLLTAIFLSYNIESAKQGAFIGFAY